MNGLYQRKMIGVMKNTANRPRVRGKHEQKNTGKKEFTKIERKKYIDSLARS